MMHLQSRAQTWSVTAGVSKEHSRLLQVADAEGGLCANVYWPASEVPYRVVALADSAARWVAWVSVDQGSDAYCIRGDRSRAAKIAHIAGGEWEFAGPNRTVAWEAGGSVWTTDGEKVTRLAQLTDEDSVLGVTLIDNELSTLVRRVGGVFALCCRTGAARAIWKPSRALWRGWERSPVCTWLNAPNGAYLVITDQYDDFLNARQRLVVYSFDGSLREVYRARVEQGHHAQTAGRTGIWFSQFSTRGEGFRRLALSTDRGWVWNSGPEFGGRVFRIVQEVGTGAVEVRPRPRSDGGWVARYDLDRDSQPQVLQTGRRFGAGFVTAMD